MTKHNELYEAPTVEVIEVKYEGVICASSGMQDYDWSEYYEE